MQGAKWTPEGEAFLRANYRVMSPEGIAEYLGITRSAVCGKANRMGISLPRGVRQAQDHEHRKAQESRRAKAAPKPASDRANHRFDWTPERLQQLREGYREHGATYFAEKFGVTKNTIFQRAYRMGLTGKKSKPLTPAAIADCLTGPRGQSLRIVETVTARTAKPKQCAWIEPANGNGFRKRCTELAVPGKAWCPCCQSRVDAIREVA